MATPWSYPENIHWPHPLSLTISKPLTCTHHPSHIHGVVRGWSFWPYPGHTHVTSWPHLVLGTYWPHNPAIPWPRPGHMLTSSGHTSATSGAHPDHILATAWQHPHNTQVIFCPSLEDILTISSIHPGHILTTLYANSRYPLTITWSNGWSHHIIINATWSVIFWPHPSQIISTTRPPLVPYEHPDNIINTPWPYYCYILTTAWSHTGYKLTTNGQNFDF